jgi:uncharacterized protein (TIGR04255 family)
VQIGKGILTVNDTASYDWKSDFFGRCKAAVEGLIKKYPGQIFDLPFQSISLKYVDAYEFDFEANDLFEFMRNRMRLTSGLPPALLATANAAGNPFAFLSEFGYSIPDPKGQLRFKIARGSRLSDKRGLVVWETEIKSKDADIPKSVDDIAAWLARAHDVASEWFFELIKGQLEEEFS